MDVDTAPQRAPQTATAPERADAQSDLDLLPDLDEDTEKAEEPTSSHRSRGLFLSRSRPREVQSEFGNDMRADWENNNDAHSRSSSPSPSLAAR